MVLTCLSLTITACSDDESNDDENDDGIAALLVGTWQYTQEDYAETMTFNSDGTFTMIVKTYIYNDWYTQSVTGTYRNKKNILTISTDGIEISFRIKSVTSTSLTVETENEETEIPTYTYQKV